MFQIKNKILKIKDNRYNNGLSFQIRKSLKGSNPTGCLIQHIWPPWHRSDNLTSKDPSGKRNRDRYVSNAWAPLPVECGPCRQGGETESAFLMDGLSFCRSVTLWGFSNNRAPRDKLTIHLLHVYLAKPLSYVIRLGESGWAGLGWWRHKIPLWTRPTSFRNCLHQGKKSHCILCLRSFWKRTCGQDVAMWLLHHNINFQRTNLTMPFPDFKLLRDPGCPHKLTVRGRTGPWWRR